MLFKSSNLQALGTGTLADERWRAANDSADQKRSQLVQEKETKVTNIEEGGRGTQQKCTNEVSRRAGDGTKTVLKTLL